MHRNSCFIINNLHWGLATRNPLFVLLRRVISQRARQLLSCPQVSIECNNRTKLFAQTTAVAPRTHLLVHPPHLFVEVLGGGALMVAEHGDCAVGAIVRQQPWCNVVVISCEGRGQESETGCTGGAREQSIAASLHSDVTMPSKRNETRITSYISARKRQRLQSHFIPSEGEQQNSGLEPISALPHHQSHAHRMWRQKYSAADRNNRTPLAPRRQT